MSIKNAVLEQDFNKAVAELAFVIHNAEMQLKTEGWGFWGAGEGDAPESFQKLKSFGKQFPVANYGCDKSIYPKDVNIAWRFWHDCMHILYEKNFSKDAELFVMDRQLAYAKRLGVSQLALDIFEADMKGQVLYYAKHGEFVDNQKAFVQSCLKVGIKNAIKVRH